jgi:hypothetical protein
MALPPVRRPARDHPDHSEAPGKCATCHLQESAAIVHELERSAHARRGVNCLDCHRPLPGQEAKEHRGFTISAAVTAGSCAECHRSQYDQFLRSRHAAPAFAAVRGSEPFTEEQIEAAERFHPGAVRRPPNALAVQEGEAAIERGCVACHAVGRPNPDGSIGTCSACHARHQASVALAREPQTCGQCHMGPDHSQIEIYNESKHGALYNAQRRFMDLTADPKKLTVRDMWVPTCATCHMSGLEGQRVTHDTTERLSYWLFAEVSERRPTYAQGQAQMKEVCLICHTTGHVERFYEEAEAGEPEAPRLPALLRSRRGLRHAPGRRSGAPGARRPGAGGRVGALPSGLHRRSPPPACRRAGAGEHLRGPRAPPLSPSRRRELG